MEKWEGTMTASERRILTTNFIAQAMNHVMGNEMEEMRLKCFEKTGCLLTWTPHPLHDAKVKPQGIPAERIQVPLTQTNIQQPDIPLEGTEAEAAAIAEEEAFISEIENDIELEVDDGIDEN